MYPILYRKKTRIRFYLCLLGAALCLRLLCAPDLRETARREARELLSRSELLRGVVFLETGMRTTEASPIESTDNAARRDEQCSPADEQPDPAARRDEQCSSAEPPQGTDAAASRDEQCSSADKQPGADNADKQCLSLHKYRLGGPSCLSGDVIGDYCFHRPLQIGDLVLFGDLAIYSTCKNNTFNGMPLPNIYRRREDGTLEQLTDFGYRDFKMRLGRIKP